MNYHGNTPKHISINANQPTLRYTLDQMEKLRRSTKARPDAARCKKHTKHQQSPGVCSLCLREKLEKVARKLSTYSGSSLPRRTLSTTSPSTCSSSGSSSSSPAPECQQKAGLFRSGGENNVLSKSRSMVNYFPRRVRGKEGSDEKKKSGFWSKLLRPRSKRREESLVHSRTVREVRVPNMVY